MDALSIAASALTAAADRFSASAQRLANGAGDIATELTEQLADKAAFKASAAVVRTADDMQKRLLDILA